VLLQALVQQSATEVSFLLLAVGEPRLVYAVAMDASTGLRSKPEVAILRIENPAGIDVPVVIDAVRQAIALQSRSDVSVNDGVQVGIVAPN
jgi:hypothetical protein